jgi:hypothetical protein
MVKRIIEFALLDRNFFGSASSTRLPLADCLLLLSLLLSVLVLAVESLA